MLHVGFTGTRSQLTKRQFAWLETEMHLIDLTVEMTQPEKDKKRVPVSELVTLHHGDCVGADATAHAIAQIMGWNIELHPPTNESMRAFSKGASKTHRPMKYLARDRIIARRSSLLLAVPGTPLRAIDRQGGRGMSGTWYTVLEALRVGLEVRIYGGGTA